MDENKKVEKLEKEIKLRQLKIRLIELQNGTQDQFSRLNIIIKKQSIRKLKKAGVK